MTRRRRIDVLTRQLWRIPLISNGRVSRLKWTAGIPAHRRKSWFCHFRFDMAVKLLLTITKLRKLLKS